MAATNRQYQGTRSMWFALDRRSPLVTVRVVGLNLQGKSQKQSSITSFFIKELKSTIFILQFQVATFSWQLSKTFDELRLFYQHLCSDPALTRGKELLKVGFPPGRDGEDDTMILVERREHIEAFIKEVLANIDFALYPPLDNFIEGNKNVTQVVSKVKIVSRVLRKFLAKQKFNLRLFKFYSKELLDFVYKLENGVEVYNVDNLYGPQHHGRSGYRPDIHILWLDICEEPGLSRVCIAPKEVFELPKEYEDDRLSNGVFLSDIAEIRRGASSHAFRRPHSAQHNHLVEAFFTSSRYYQTENCVSIVGSERTLSFQFVDQSKLKQGRKSVYRHNKIARFLFIDMLNLLSIQSLTITELQKRNRRFQRANPDISVKPAYPGSRVTAKRKDDADKILKLLITGIEVDEENFSPHYGALQITHKRLQYNTATRQLMISCLGSTEAKPTLVPIPALSTSPTAVQPPAAVDTPTADGAPAVVYEEDRTSFGDLTNTPALMKDEIRRNLVYSSEEDGEHSSSEFDDFSDLSDSDTDGDSDAEPEAASQPVDAGFESDMFAPHWRFDVTTQDRTMDVDDISEVRPGKVSSTVDGTEDALYVSIISSESILVLPVPTLTVRNNLIRRFQAFIQLHRNYEALDCDTPAVFKPPFTKKARAELTDEQRALRKAKLQARREKLQAKLAAQRAAYARQDSQNSGSGKVTFNDDVGVAATPAYHKRRGSYRQSPSPGGSFSGDFNSPISASSVHHVYSHTKPLKAVSVLRRSSASSKGTSFGTSSLSEALRSSSFD